MCMPVFFVLKTKNSLCSDEDEKLLNLESVRGVEWKVIHRLD